MALLATLIIILAAGIGVGVFMGRRGSSNVHKLKHLEEELQNSRNQMNVYQTNVTDHFHKTASLFANLTKQYQEVYTHLADGAQSLCTDDNVSEKIAQFAPNPLLEESALHELRNIAAQDATLPEVNADFNHAAQTSTQTQDPNDFTAGHNEPFIGEMGEPSIETSTDGIDSNTENQKPVKDYA